MIVRNEVNVNVALWSHAVELSTVRARQMPSPSLKAPMVCYGFPDLKVDSLKAIQPMQLGVK